MDVRVGEALPRALGRPRNCEIAAMARDGQSDMNLEEVAGAVLVVQLLDGDTASGEPPEPMLQLVHVLAQFRLDRWRRLQIVKGDFQRRIHDAIPLPVTWNSTRP